MWRQAGERRGGEEREEWGGDCRREMRESKMIIK